MSSKKKKAASPTAQMFSAEAAFVANDVPMSSPYAVIIRNYNDVAHKIELFGFNRNHNKPRYGLPEMVKVLNLMDGSEAGYFELCAYLANTPNKIGKWRFQSSTEKNIRQEATYQHRNPNGMCYTRPLQLHMAKDAYQFQSGLVDMNNVAAFSGGTSLTLEIAAHSDLIVSMFPCAEVSLLSQLNGADRLTDFAAPRLSGYDTATAAKKS